MAFFRRRAGGETVTGVEARAGFLDRLVMLADTNPAVVQVNFSGLDYSLTMTNSLIAF